MRKLFLFLVLLCVYAWALPAKESAVTLRFDEAGRFRIAQFTDQHWSHRSPNCATTVATIKHILDTEKPHLAILTGDVVTDAPAREAWGRLSPPFLQRRRSLLPSQWEITMLKPEYHGKRFSLC